MIVVKDGFALNLTKMFGFSKRKNGIVFFDSGEDAFTIFEFPSITERDEAYEKVLKAYAAGEKILRL